MPPKRASRAPSDEAPTRQSRRLRRAPDDTDDSPLRSLSTERRARRQPTSSRPAPSSALPKSSSTPAPVAPSLAAPTNTTASSDLYIGEQSLQTSLPLSFLSVVPLVSPSRASVNSTGPGSAGSPTFSESTLFIPKEKLDHEVSAASTDSGFVAAKEKEEVKRSKAALDKARKIQRIAGQKKDKELAARQLVKQQADKIRDKIARDGEGFAGHPYLKAPPEPKYAYDWTNVQLKAMDFLSDYFTTGLPADKVSYLEDVFQQARRKYGNLWPKSVETRQELHDRVFYICCQFEGCTDFFANLVADKMVESEELREEARNLRVYGQYRDTQLATVLNSMEKASHDQVTDWNFRQMLGDKIGEPVGPQTPPETQFQSQPRKTATKAVSEHASTANKKRQVSPDSDDKPSEERAKKIPRSTDSTPFAKKANLSHAATPIVRTSSSRPAQSIHKLRTLPALNDADATHAANNIIDPTTEFGRHHSVRLETKLRKQRALSGRSSIASAFPPGGIGSHMKDHPEADDKAYMMSNAFQAPEVTTPGSTGQQNQVTTQSESHAPQTPGSGRWGIGSVIGKVGSAISFGYSMIRSTPTQHEPAPNSSPTPQIPSQGQTPTPTAGTSSQDRDPEDPGEHTQSPLVGAEGEEDEQLPTTPTPSSATGANGETSSRKRMPQSSTPARPRGGWQERIRKMQEKKRKTEAAEAAQRQAEWKAQSKRFDEEHAKMHKYFMDNPVPSSDIKEVLRKRESGLQVGFKRKFRVDDLAEIPRPRDGSFDVFSYFEEESDGEDYCYVDEWGFLSKRGVHDVINTDELSRPTTTKRVRFAENLETGPTPSKPSWSAGLSTPPRSGSLNDVTPALASSLKVQSAASLTSGDPHHAQPYLGTMFAESLEQMEAERNIFGSAKSPTRKSTISEEERNAIAYGQKHKVWTGPKVTPRPGSFTVPDDSDSDTESEIDGDDNVTQAGQHQSVDGNATSPDTQAENAVETTQNRTSETTLAGKADAAPLEPSTPSLTNIGGGASGVPQTQADSNDALARARSQAEKYKPKTPSALRASSRLSSSPAVTDFAANVMATTVASAETEPVKTIETSDEITTTTAIDMASVATEGTSSEQTLQHTSESADKVTLDTIQASTFVFPPPKPAPWAHLVTTEIQAALDDWFARPEADEYCNNLWQQHYATYQREKVAGIHSSAVTPAATATA